MLVKCSYDGCHEFEPNSHNHVYCQECKCKRKSEARNKRLEKPLEYTEETFQLEENRKIALLERRLAKNKWILENKSFAIFDIETTALDADGDELLCACIKPLRNPVKTFVSDIWYRGNDTRIVGEIRDELKNYDYIVGWYSTNFDIPFLTTRLLLTKQEPIGNMKHIDLYYTARHNLKFHSNRLDSIAEGLFNKSRKTRLSKPLWKRAQSFDDKERREALKYIIDHCEQDVIELENIFYELVDFRNLSATPLRKY